MLEKYEVLLSIKAKDDLKSIVFYIKNTLNEPIIAKKYSKMIREEIEALEYYPKRNSVIDNEIIADLEIRKRIVKNHIIFYRIDEIHRTINIERILYVHQIG